MKPSELQDKSEQFLIKLADKAGIHQSVWCELSLMESELKLDRETSRKVVRDLESKGFVEFIPPQLVIIKSLGANESKKYLATYKPFEDKSISDVKSNVNQITDNLQKYIFIIHGHDELNLLKLEKIIKERWKLIPLILKDKPGGSITLMEIFEEEARKASYAFAIYTPDDFVEVKGSNYLQARPNTIFELGWFFGHLGRKNVSILCKIGTKIHSDLDGIRRIDFRESIEEKIMDIENELKRRRAYNLNYAYNISN